jgi:hypothetical protein
MNHASMGHDELFAPEAMRCNMNVRIPLSLIAFDSLPYHFEVIDMLSFKLIS